MGVKKLKPTSPGRRFQTVSDFATVTKSKPEKQLARQAEAFLRVATPMVGSLRVTVVVATRSVTASSTSVVPRTGCPPRSPPSSTTRTAMPASPCSTTLDGEKRYIIAPVGLKVGELARIRARCRDPHRQRTAAAQHPDGCRGAQRRDAPRWRRQDGPLRRCRHPAHVEGERASRCCVSPRARCGRCRSTAGPPSVRWATPRPS